MTESMPRLEGGDIPDFEQKFREGRIRAVLDDAGKLLGYEEMPDDGRGLERSEKKKEKAPVDPNALAEERLVESLRHAEERMKKALEKQAGLSTDAEERMRVTMYPWHTDHDEALKQEKDIAEREVSTQLKEFRTTRSALDALKEHGAVGKALEALEAEEAEAARTLSAAESEEARRPHRDRLETLAEARGKLERIMEDLENEEE